MKDKTKIVETEKSLIGKITNFFTKSNLRVENEILKQKIKSYQELEKKFFNKTKVFEDIDNLIENYSKQGLEYERMKKENKDLKEEIAKIKEKKDKEKKEEKEKEKMYQDKIKKLSGKKKDLFELYFLKKVRKKSDLLSELEIKENYFRQLKFMINKEVGVKIT